MPAPIPPLATPTFIWAAPIWAAPTKETPTQEKKKRDHNAPDASSWAPMGLLGGSCSIHQRREGDWRRWSQRRPPTQGGGRKYRGGSFACGLSEGTKKGGAWKKMPKAGVSGCLAADQYKTIKLQGGGLLLGLPPFESNAAAQPGQVSQSNQCLPARTGKIQVDLCALSKGCLSRCWSSDPPRGIPPLVGCLLPPTPQNHLGSGKGAAGWLAGWGSPGKEVWGGAFLPTRKD